MSRLRDFGYSLLIATLVPVLHHLFDAAYYTDLWVFRYDYIPIILIPLACLIICSIAKPEPFFLTGVSLAFSLPLIAMFAYTTIWPVVDGRGLDYFLGSLGAFLGALLSLAYLKHKKARHLRALSGWALQGRLHSTRSLSSIFAIRDLLVAHFH